MSKCQQAQTLLTHLKARQAGLSSSNQELLELRTPISSRLRRTTLGTGRKQEAREQLYEQIRNTNIEIRNTIEQLESILYVFEVEAERILSEKELFLGSEAVKDLFDVKLEKTDIPPIPFSRKELQKAAELGLVLMLVINKDQDGNLLTAKRIGEVTQEKLKAVDPEFQGLFHDTTWYQGEPFYATNTPWTTLQKNSITAMKATAVQAQWILISKETLLNSKKKNFLEQTFLLAEHLKNNILPQIKNQQRRQPYLEALAELAAKRELLNFDAWYDQLTDEQKIQLAKLLINLKINQLTRPDFATMIYLQAMYLKVYHQYLFAKEYALVNETSTLHPGRLVGVGLFDRDGVLVARGGWDQIVRAGSLGVSFLSSL